MNALRKLSTGQRAAVAFAALVIATTVTEIITGAGPGVRAVTVLILAVIPGVWLTLRLIGPAKGEHAVPRGYVHDDDMPTAIVDRVPTEHDPPWEPAPLAAPVPVPEPAEPDGAPVIEPDAIHGPPQVVITATASGERLTSVQVAVHPPLHWPGELIPPVAELLGHPTVDAALEAMCAQWHSWESNFTKGDTRQLRAALTDGAP